MTFRRTIRRAVRGATLAMRSPSRLVEKFEQHRLIERGRRTFAENGLERRLRGILSDAFSPKYDDLYRLWSLAREQTPRLILEYGSGCSTIVLAAALVQNQKEGKGTGRLLSIEGYGDWMNHTLSQLTPEEREIVELRELHPQVVTRRVKVNNRGSVVWYGVHRGVDVEQGIVGLVYPELQDLSPDMIYLDGPDPHSVPGYVDSAGTVFPPVVLDPLMMEDHLPVGMRIVVDGRPSNSMVLRNNFQSRWKVEILGQQKCTVFQHLDRF